MWRSRRRLRSSVSPILFASLLVPFVTSNASGECKSPRYEVGTDYIGSASGSRDLLHRIGSPGAERARGEGAELGIPADVTAIAPIIVGVPSGSTAAALRRDPDILCWK